MVDQISNLTTGLKIMTRDVLSRNLNLKKERKRNRMNVIKEETDLHKY